MPDFSSLQDAMRAMMRELQKALNGQDEMLSELSGNVWQLRSESGRSTSSDAAKCVQAKVEAMTNNELLELIAVRVGYTN